MGQWITQRGHTLQPFAQKQQMECWIATYRMILQANGLTYDLDTIEKKLKSGGFSQAGECRTRGIKDWEFTDAAKALKMGCTTTKAISSYQGLRNMLNLCGPLWVAGVFKMDEPGGGKKDYHHIIAVIGVDEDRESICWVNPWKWNAYDEVTKLWSGWKWFYSAISKTFNMEGSLQYLTPIQAAALSLAP